MALNPLHQFEIREISTLDLGVFQVAFTNQSLWMVLAIGAIVALFGLGARKPALVPGRLQAFVELTYEFISNLVEGSAGKEALKFLPLIFTLFLFIAALNLFGMIPGSYTATSQIFMTGAMAFTVFLLVVALGFITHGVKFLGMFFPHGTPLYLAPLIIPLEVISFFARPFTLAIRLCANMVAGHVLMKILASFVIMLGGWFALSAVAPLVLLVAISALEVFVALLQAYIFTVLTCVYLNDSLHMH